MELQELISKIMQKSELSGEEVLHNIKMKQKEFQDLIDENAAAKLIAKELELGIPEEELVTEFNSIADIQFSKPSEASLVARIMNINSPKAFETERKKGRVCNIEIADGTGKGLLVLWDEDVRWMEKNSLERDDVLLIKNAQVKTYNPLELNSTLLTELIPFRPQEFANSKHYGPLPQQPARITNVKSIREGEIVDMFARVLQIAEMREFARENKVGKVLNLLISDGEGMQIPLVLWDYNADYANKWLKIGDAIKVENAIVKKAPAGLELQLNWASHLIAEPKVHNLRNEEELLRETLPSVKLLDLKTGNRGIVKATVSKIDKAEMRNGELYVQAELNDEINIPVIFSGRRALEILQLRNLPKLPIELLLKLKEEYIKGKRVTLVVSKEKDRTGTVAKYYCEHVMHFI
ncbi:MAG: hypothetical protein V1835_05085 [Candidatus Micrarchaeota archaeon]